MKKIVSVIPLALLIGIVLRVSAQSSITRTFEGFIAEKYPIVMSIAVDEQQIVTGVYYYKKIGTNLALRGTVSSEGFFEIEEQDPNGNATGIFRAKIVGKTGFSGFWTTPDGGKSLSFFLEEVPPCRFGPTGCAAEVKTKSIALEGPDDFQGSIQWPMIFGVENETAMDLMRNMLVFDKVVDVPLDEVIAEFKGCGCGIVEVDYAVNYNQFPFLDIEFNIVGMGAHLSYNQEYYTFDVRTGKRLGAQDLFVAERMMELAAFVNNRLQENIDATKEEIGEDLGEIPMLSHDYTFTESNLESFSIDDSVVTFHYRFDFPNAFRAAEPSGEIRISYDQLRPFLSDRVLPFLK